MTLTEEPQSRMPVTGTVVGQGESPGLRVLVDRRYMESTGAALPTVALAGRCLYQVMWTRKSELEGHENELEDRAQAPVGRKRTS